MIFSRVRGTNMRHDVNKGSLLLILTGNLMKRGCRRRLPYLGTDQELLYALNGTISRSLATTDDLQVVDESLETDDCDALKECVFDDSYSTETLYKYAKFSGISKQSCPELVNGLTSTTAMPTIYMAYSSPSVDQTPELESSPHIPPSTPIWTTVLDERLFSQYHVPSNSPIPSLTVINMPQSTNVYIDSKYLDKVVPEERSEIEIVTKLFIHPDYATPEVIDQAIKTLFLFLKTTYIDTLVLSIGSEGSDTASSEYVLALWPVLEKAHKENIIRRLGVADFSSEQLESFLSKINDRPTTNQIRLDYDGVEELVNFGKKNDVEMTTHKDPKGKNVDKYFYVFTSLVILRNDNLEKVLKHHNLLSSSSQIIRPIWIARYHFLITSRGIVSNKGQVLMINTSCANASIRYAVHAAVW